MRWDDDAEGDVVFDFAFVLVTVVVGGVMLESDDEGVLVLVVCVFCVVFCVFLFDFEGGGGEADETDESDEDEGSGAVSARLHTTYRHTHKHT